MKFTNVVKAVSRRTYWPLMRLTGGIVKLVVATEKKGRENMTSLYKVHEKHSLLQPDPNEKKERREGCLTRIGKRTFSMQSAK